MGVTEAVKTPRKVLAFVFGGLVFIGEF